MSGHGWITIPKWRSFQHYQNRDPIWIKNYRELLHKEEYLCLSASDRGVLHGIWLCISESGDCRLSADPKSLARRLNVRRVSLEPLIDAGFIKVRASKGLAPRYQPATPEGLKPLKRKRPASGAPKKAPPPGLGTNGERILSDAENLAYIAQLKHRLTHPEHPASA